MEQGAGSTDKQSHGKCTEYASLLPGISPAGGGQETTRPNAGEMSAGQARVFGSFIIRGRINLI